VLEVLIRHGAKVSEEFDAQGKTALSLAAQAEASKDVIKLLVEAGADPTDLQVNGSNLLELYRLRDFNHPVVTYLDSLGVF
jgi:ankyrin repeat protein